MSAAQDDRHRSSPAEKPRSHADAAERLSDAPFLAYALVQSMRLFIALVSRRWPEAT